MSLSLAEAAIVRGSARTLRTALRGCRDINATIDEDGTTLLHLACKQQNLECLRVCIISFPCLSVCTVMSCLTF